MTKKIEIKKSENNLGKRVFAGIIDYGIIYLFMMLFTVGFGEKTSIVQYKLSGLPALIPIIFWGIMTIGTEQLFGKTLGNYTVGLKPISIDNTKLTFGQSLKRHLLDPIDMIFFGLVGILLINNTENNQRLGDIWAKTIVISMKN